MTDVNSTAAADVSNNNERKYKFNRIFKAKVTPGAVETRQGAKGDYTYAAKSRIEYARMNGDIEIVERTLMAFGNPRIDTLALVAEGQEVELAVQFDNRVVKIVGLPRDEAPAAKAA